MLTGKLASPAPVRYNGADPLVLNAENQAPSDGPYAGGDLESECDVEQRGLPEQGDQGHNPADGGGHETEAEARLRVVVTADNHLAAYSPRLSPQRLNERRRRLATAFARTVDEAIDRRVHLFIQAGDLFDSTDPRNLEREFIARQLVRLRDAGIHVFAVGGNHDTPRQRTEHGGYSPQGIYAELGGLHYFPESQLLRPVAVEAAGMRVAVAGLSNDPGAAPGGDPLDGARVDDPAGILTQADLGILVLHAAIEGHGFPGEDESVVRRASIQRLHGFHVVLAGHVHAYARFRVGDTAVVVAGPTERMEFGESESASGFAYLELTRQGVRRVEHIAIAPQPRHVVTVRTSELWPRAREVSNNADSLSRPTGDVADGDYPPSDTDILLSPARSARLPDTTMPLAGTDALPHADAGASATPTRMIITKMAPFCQADAMVRLRLEGPITREQYRMLDLPQIWITGQRSAFSFELDESGLIMTARGSADAVARGERVAPRDMLETVAREWVDRAESASERALLARTRERILASFDLMTGREGGQ